MVKLYAVMAAFVFAVRLRFERRVEERGLGTLEMVVIALGLFLAATAAIVVIRRAITSRTSRIH